MIQISIPNIVLIPISNRYWIKDFKPILIQYYPFILIPIPSIGIVILVEPIMNLTLIVEISEQNKNKLPKDNFVFYKGI